MMLWTGYAGGNWLVLRLMGWFGYWTAMRCVDALASLAGETFCRGAAKRWLSHRCNAMLWYNDRAVATDEV